MKVRCTQCDWVGDSDEVLRGENPFEAGTTIWGCPECRDIDHLNRACDEPECREYATCGTPVKGDYRHTCGMHKP